MGVPSLAPFDLDLVHTEDGEADGHRQHLTGGTPGGPFQSLLLGGFHLLSVDGSLTDRSGPDD